MTRLFNGCKALFQSGNDIVDMLRADRQADRIRLDPLIQKFFGCELGMGRGRGMDHERFHVGNVSKQREDLQICIGVTASCVPPMHRSGVPFNLLLWFSKAKSAL